MKKLTVEQIETAEISYQVGKYFPTTNIGALEELQEQIANKNRKMDDHNLSDLLDESVEEWRGFVDYFKENLLYSQWQDNDDEFICSQSDTILGVNVEIIATVKL